MEPASLVEDLLRRDFTVNAIAVTLDGEHAGEVHAAPGALEDLRAGRLRVLHEQSFVDDPTRLLRIARYSARLGFELEPGTAALASEAIDTRALDTVSGARIGAELRLALGEANVLAALAALSELGALGALHPRLRFEQPVARATLALLPGDGRAEVALLASLVLPLALRAGEIRTRRSSRCSTGWSSAHPIAIASLQQLRLCVAWWMSCRPRSDPHNCVPPLRVSRQRESRWRAV